MVNHDLGDSPPQSGRQKRDSINSWPSQAGPPLMKMGWGKSEVERSMEDMEGPAEEGKRTGWPH